MKAYKFFLHFNKPASLKAKKPQVSVHYRNTCYIVDNVNVAVPTRGKINETQPKFVIVGSAANFVVKKNVAYLY